jgi:hypothetical protein
MSTSAKLSGGCGAQGYACALQRLAKLIDGKKG